MDEKIIRKIVDVSKEIIEKLSLAAEISAELHEGQEGEKSYLDINISGEELGLLIGFKGAGLRAMQQYLTTIMIIELNKEEGERPRLGINLDVNDYKKKQEEQVRSNALRAIVQVTETSQPVELPAMNPADRRIVHMVVAENEGIISESIGEEGERKVVIKPSE